MHTILPADKNPALHKPSREIPLREIRGTKVQKLITDMKKLLAKEEHGVALAAVQVGEPRQGRGEPLRLFIISGRALARGARNAPDEPRDFESRPPEANPPLAEISNLEPAPPDQVYINPVLVKISRKKIEKHEGCLSIRGKWGEVPRAEKATLRYVDENGHQTTRGASGFLAHIFQHEMDHLEGILYTDKATAVYDEQPNKKH